ncbi:MAG: hypothetical protein U0452_06495 [Anaerolineae bacterium]
MRQPRLILLLLSLAVLLALAGGAAAQSGTGTVQAQIELRVDAGYDGYFRELEWIPVRVRVVNNGPDVTGRLVVRPETSGDALTNTFSAPVVLPQGAQQTVWLYVTARSYANQVRVDLLNESGAVLTSASDVMGALRPGDRLAVVVTDAPASAVDLSGAAISSFNAYQVNWNIDEMPPLAAALAGIDLMLFDEVDTGALTTAQSEALAAWVRAGGHLMASGGASWQPTAIGLNDLLPLTPDDAQTVPGLVPIAEWLVEPNGQALESDALIATGPLTPNAQVLVETEDGQPLIARRFLGNGVVDYLAPSPNEAPLRDWSGMTSLWFTLETSRGPIPGWARGFENWSQAQQAISIIPGVDPLPDILPLALFLLAYVLVVGPANYFILARANRREWAWATIPLTILGFSAIAWLIGSNLRGAEPILNQLTAVEAWADEENAVADGLVGLLSPRRAQYTLETGNGDVLRPIPLSQTSSLLVRGAQSSVNIQQTESFAAVDFAVDSSFVAGFNQTGPVTAPPVGGSATLSYDPTIAGQMTARGAIRNDGVQTLRSPVVLGRGAALQLEDLAPGAVVPFELVLPGTFPASPAPYLPSTITPYLTFRTARMQDLSDQTATDLLGERLFRPGDVIALSNPEDQQRVRDQLFVSSLVDDSFDATGRGDRLYLAGWMDGTPLETNLIDQSAAERTSTLVITALQTDIVPASGTVTIGTDRFTWVVTNYTGLNEVTPVDLNLQPGEEVAFRFTPLPTAVLGTVEQFAVVLENLNVASRRVPIYLYDWAAKDWVSMDVGRGGLTLTDDAARYLGPQNAVQIRMVADEIGGYLRIGTLGVTQRGRFDAG